MVFTNKNRYVSILKVLYLCYIQKQINCCFPTTWLIFNYFSYSSFILRHILATGILVRRKYIIVKKINKKQKIYLNNCFSLEVCLRIILHLGSWTSGRNPPSAVRLWFEVLAPPLAVSRHVVIPKSWTAQHKPHTILAYRHRRHLCW